MKKINKLYSFSNNRQLWRLLPADTEKLIIEERNTETKEAFFNCLNIRTGKIIFKDLQLDEKFWIGIEVVYTDIIYFHKFIKPDMPQHRGIIAFEIDNQRILWQNDEYSFLFIYDDKIYCYITGFEGRNFYLLNYKTGEVLNHLGNSADNINIIREKVLNANNFKGYSFPVSFNFADNENNHLKNILKDIMNNIIIKGAIEFVNLDKIILFNYHEELSNGLLKNSFKIIDTDTQKILLEVTLNKETKAFVPDSFFVKDDLIFLLKEKVMLEVYSIKR